MGGRPHLHRALGRSGHRPAQVEGDGTRLENTCARWCPQREQCEWEREHTRAAYLTAFCRLAYSPAMLRGKKASTTLCGREPRRSVWKKVTTLVLLGSL